MDNRIEDERKIIKKLFDIRNEVDKIVKDSNDSYHKSQYVSDMQVVAIFKPLFKKHNLFFIRTRTWNVEKEMYEVTVTYYDVESGAKFAITDDVPLTQRNTQGYGALTTYLTRYFNLEMFFVETTIDNSYETQSPVTTKVVEDKPVDKKNPFADRAKKEK
jgi:hypothetical protein